MKFLLLAIADDATGLDIIAVFYPQDDLVLQWFLLWEEASAVAHLLFNLPPRHLDKGGDSRPITFFVCEKISFRPYAVASALSWYGFQQAGLHLVLDLIPVIPAIPMPTFPSASTRTPSFSTAAS